MPTARLTTALQMLSETPTLVCAHGVVGFKWWFLKRSCSHQNGGNFHFAICITLYGGFLKWWYKTTMGFPTKKDPFGVFLRVPPFKETPICHPVFSPYGVREFFFPSPSRSCCQRQFFQRRVQRTKDARQLSRRGETQMSNQQKGGQQGSLYYPIFEGITQYKSMANQGWFSMMFLL